MPTWERMWDDFVQGETRLVGEAFGQQQIVHGDEDLALWRKGKKKTDEEVGKVPSLGPHHREERETVGKREICGGDWVSICAKGVVGHAVSRHSISATRGPRDIISLVIHKMGITSHTLHFWGMMSSLGRLGFGGARCLMMI
jgi:hypothetical protein